MNWRRYTDAAVRYFKRYAWIPLVGVLLLFISTTFEHPAMGRAFVEHLGVAFVVAAFIIGTVDIFFRGEFAADVFRAALRYVVPKDVVDELLALSQTWIICSEHSYRFELEKMSPERVKLRGIVSRTLKNEGSEAVKLKIKLGLDDWFFEPNSTCVLEYKMQRQNSPVVDLIQTIQKRKAGWILQPAEPVTLRRNETIRIWHIYEEVRHVNDMGFLESIYATKNLRIEMKVDPSLAYNLGIGHRAPLVSAGLPDTWEMKGLILPHQALHIRWWDRAAEEKWRTGSESVADVSP